MARKPRVEYEITAEDKSAAALRQAENQLKAVASGVGTFAVGAAGAMAGLGAAVMSMADKLDRLAKNAKAAGVGVETYQAWEFAATQAGASTEEFVSALQRANVAIGQVANGSGPAVAVFDRLGVAVKDVNGDVRSTESVIMDFAQAVSKLKSPAEQAAASAAVFGRSAGPAMALLLRDGEAGLRAYEEQARKLGVVISEEATVAADEFNDRMDALQRVITAQTANAIFKNADAIESLATAMGKVVGWGVSGAAAVVRFVESISEDLAAAIGGIAANDVPRLSEALREAQENLARLEGQEGGRAARGSTLPQRIAEARTEVERLTEALQRAQDMTSRGLGFTRPGDAAATPQQPTAAANEPPPQALTDGQLAEIEKRERQANELRIRIAQEFNASVDAERQTLLEQEDLFWQEKLAIAAGYADLQAQQQAERDQQLWAAQMEARAQRFEEELAVELGYKDARDRALQESEQAHQDALLEIRTRQFGTFQRQAIELAKFETMKAKEKTLTALSWAQQLTQGLAQNSKAAFNLNKAAAIAEAIVNTATGVTAALRLGPYGIPLAALIAAQGAAQIATISSTQFGGAASGMTSAGPGTGIPSMANDMFKAPEVSAADRNNQTIKIEIAADDSEIARLLMKNVRVVTNQEDDTLFSSRSRQALETA